MDTDDTAVARPAAEISSLEPEAQHDPADAPTGSIRLARVVIGTTNPRKRFDEAALAELTESIRRHGVLQPILVRPLPGERYELVSGERRYRAATAAGLRTIPALVRDMGDQEVLEVQLVENLQRAGLHELEEAEGYERLMQDHAYTVDELAVKVGKSKAYVYARLKLTDLCAKARDAFYAGKLNASTALLVARIPLADLQIKAVKEITEHWAGGMPYRQAAEHVQRTYMLRLDQAPFPRHDAGLVPAAGACGACPKRTGKRACGREACMGRARCALRPQRGRSFAMIHIDTGDIVFHRPSRETWLVAYVRGGRLSACGWPDTLANLADCLLVEKASNQERLKLLREMTRCDGHRGIYARDVLRANDTAFH